MKQQKVRPYRWLARYYDKVFRLHRSRGDKERKALLADILPRVESACYLACDTGTTASWLASQGIRTFGGRPLSGNLR